MKNKNLKMLLIAGLAAGTLTCAAGGAVYASAYGNVNGTNTGTLTSAVTLSSFALDTGASVRTKDPMGIRFEASISAEDLAKLPADADFGVLVMPTDILNGAELTKETSITKAGAETPVTPEDIPAETWHNTKCTETTKYYTGVIGGIEGADLPESYYDVDLTAVAYVTYKYTPAGGTEQTETIYTNTTTRSCVQVAATALKNKDGATWATPEAVQTLEGVVDTVVGEIAFNADTVTVPVGCAAALPTLTGNDGLDIYYSADNGATVSNGLVTCESEGSYTVTARLGSRVDTVTVSAQTPKALVAGLKAKAYSATEIQNAVNIDVPEIGTSNITAAWGASYTVVDEDTVSVVLADKSVRGETSVCFATADGIYSVGVVVADRKITTEAEAKKMLTERMFATAQTEVEREYIVLGNDIGVAQWKDEANAYNSKKYFYDTFDGRGNKIYGTSSAQSNGMWTSGMFGVMHGATVKNLVVERPIIRADGGESAVLATSIKEKATIENNVIIDAIQHAGNGAALSGMIAASVWGDNNVIKNNLIIDTWTTKPAVGNHTADGAITSANTKGFGAIYGAIGGSGLPKSLGGSANNTQIMDDNYVLSARDYLLSYHISGGALQDKTDDGVADDYIDSKYMVNSLTELLGKVGKLSSFSPTAKRGMQIAYENAVARNSDSLSSELQAYLNDIIANMTAQSLTTISSAPIFLASEVTDGTVSITLPENTIVYEDIVNYSGCESISGTGRTVTVTLADTSARGEVDFSIETEDKEYSYTVVIADRKITTADEFKTMLSERMFADAAVVERETEYIVLANNIEVGDTKNASGNYYYSQRFYDTFDGRGNMIYGPSASGMWTSGMFGTLSGGTIRNLVVKNAIIRNAGYNAGVLTYSVNEGSTIENNVIINPIHNANVANIQTGVLSATVWGNNNVIRNNLIVDMWTTKPAVGNHASDGAITGDNTVNFAAMYGAIGGSGLPTSLGGSASSTQIMTDNYLISTRDYALGYFINGGVYQDKDGDGTRDDYIDSKYRVADYAAFKTAVGDVAEFNSLIVDNGTTVTVGGVTIYTY